MRIRADPDLQHCQNFFLQLPTFRKQCYLLRPTRRTECKITQSWILIRIRIRGGMNMCAFSSFRNYSISVGGNMTKVRNFDFRKKWHCFLQWDVFGGRVVPVPSKKLVNYIWESLSMNYQVNFFVVCTNFFEQKNEFKIRTQIRTSRIRHTSS